MQPLTAAKRRTCRRLAANVLAALAGVALAGVVGVAGGCYTPGGGGFSSDRFTYESTSWQPWTVTLEDTRTGQAFWSVDIPVGQQLVIDFREADDEDADDFAPDTMQWALMPAGKRSGSLENSLRVPPANSRLLVPRLRKAPELPQDMVAAQGGPAPVRVINQDGRSAQPQPSAPAAGGGDQVGGQGGGR